MKNSSETTDVISFNASYITVGRTRKENITKEKRQLYTLSHDITSKILDCDLKGKSDNYYDKRYQDNKKRLDSIQRLFSCRRG